MDLRVLLVTGDRGLAELIRAQVDNLGCRCNVVERPDAGSLAWAEAIIADITEIGLDGFDALRIEAPLARVLAVAQDEEQAEAVRTGGASEVLVEPFSISEVMDAVRRLGPPSVDARVLDLRTGASMPAPEVEDAPWWATRSR